MEIPDNWGEFEKRLRSAGGRMRSAGGGMRFGGILVIALGLILLAAIFSSYYTVEPEGRAVVKRFGKVVAITDPGLHFKLPFGIDRATFVPTERVHKEEFGFRTLRAGVRTQYSDQQFGDESLMLTGDLNVIVVEWVVQYRIGDPERWMHAVKENISTIRDISEAVMRRIVGNRLGSDVLTVGRVDVALRAREEMQRILDIYGMGVHVSGVELQDVTPPDPVKPAFNEVNEARQEKERLVNLAEKERNQVIPRAQGEAAQTLSEAEAYTAERTNQAKGEAARFTAILTEYAKAPDVTRQRLYLEMLDTVLPKSNVYVIDKDAAGPLPLLDLTRRTSGSEK
jgi:membrane protease subunit HflK